MTKMQGRGAHGSRKRVCHRFRRLWLPVACVLTAEFWFAAVGGRVKGGVAAEMQSAAAKLHAAIEQVSTVGVGAIADSATDATSSENGAAPSVTIMETVDADTLIKHAADVKVGATAPISIHCFS